MSRVGSRTGAGRPGWHGRVEQCLALDIRKLHLKLTLGYWHWRNSQTGERVGSISYSVEGERLNLVYSLKAKLRIQTISLSTTPCTRGGSQPWFICPIRGERVAILYFRAERFACRQCQRLNYASTSESLDAREIGRAHV